MELTFWSSADDVYLSSVSGDSLCVCVCVVVVLKRTNKRTNKIKQKYLLLEIEIIIINKKTADQFDFEFVLFFRNVPNL